MNTDSTRHRTSSISGGGRLPDELDFPIVDLHAHLTEGQSLTDVVQLAQERGVTLGIVEHGGHGQLIDSDTAVILPIENLDYRIANREIAEIVQAHPDRLYGYTKVNQKRDRGRIGEMLDAAFDELGLKGLKIHHHPTREMMEALRRHRKPLLADVLGKVYELRSARAGVILDRVEARARLCVERSAAGRGPQLLWG